MRSTKQRMTRRSFLAAPAALAVSGAALSRSAHAIELFDASNTSEIFKAAMLSARHCARWGFADDGWLPRPFEVDLLVNDPALLRAVAARAVDIIAAGSFDAKNFSPLAVFALPKPPHGERRIWAITEPQDAVTYLTLALLAAPAIEAQRIRSSRNVVYSYRFSPGRHRLFDDRFTFASFRAAVRERADSGGVIVICDVANCFGTLTADRIAAALRQFGVARWQADYLRELLSFWQLPDSPGLPVGSNASRILAEAVLLQIDARLQDAGIEHVRYLDDFRLFVEDEASARLALEAMREAAAALGLSPKAEKTAFLHFTRAATADSAQREANQRQYLRLASESSAAIAPMPVPTQQADANEIGRLRRSRRAPDANLFLRVEPSSPVSLKTLAQALRQAIYGEHPEYLRALPQLLVGYPELAAFAAAALCSAGEVVSVDLRNHLRTEFAGMLLNPKTPDYVAAKLSEILSHPEYRDRPALERFATMRSATPRGMVFRAALDALRNSGGTTPSSAERWQEMDGWARRALLADPALRPAIAAASVNPGDLIAAKLVG